MRPKECLVKDKVFFMGAMQPGGCASGRNPKPRFARIGGLERVLTPEEFPGFPVVLGIELPLEDLFRIIEALRDTAGNPELVDGQLTETGMIALAEYYSIMCDLWCCFDKGRDHHPDGESMTGRLVADFPDALKHLVAAGPDLLPCRIVTALDLDNRVIPSPPGADAEPRSEKVK